MTDHDASRILLLEQLESRCMLASGVLLFSASNDLNEGPAQETLQSNREQSSNRDSDASRSSRNNLDTPRRGEPDRGPTSAGLHDDQFASNPSGLTPPPQSSRPGNNVPDSGSNSSGLPPSPQPPETPSVESPSNRPDVSTPPGQATLDPDDSKTGDAAVLIQRVPDVTNTIRSTGDESTVNWTTDNTTSNPGTNNQKPAAGAAGDPQRGAAPGGTIETLPLLRHSVMAPEDRDADEPWEMDSQSLRQLRSVTGSGHDDTNAADPESIDSAIASWFGGTTGLIDNIQGGHELPGVIENLTPSIVDVVLDATIGLHRSVGLIAAAETSSDPTQIRDAILAAIASEQPVLSEGIGGATQSRYSGLAYPGAAIIAGTLALATHRRKTANLLSSR